MIPNNPSLNPSTHTHRKQQPHNIAEDDPNHIPMLTDEEAWQMLAPFLSLGVLKTRDVASMLKAPLSQREDRYHMLVTKALQTREGMRRICAECGKQEGNRGVGKLKQCGKCANIW